LGIVGLALPLDALDHVGQPILFHLQKTTTVIEDSDFEGRSAAIPFLCKGGLHLSNLPDQECLVLLQQIDSTRQGEFIQ
jgi:hypothetical protein